MTGQRWVLHFDGHPLSPNDHVSPFKRHRDGQYWQGRAAIAAIEAGLPKWLTLVRLSAVFFRRNLGVADADNDVGHLKPVADGLVRAGYLPDDTRHYVEWGEISESHGRHGFDLVIEAL